MGKKTDKLKLNPDLEDGSVEIEFGDAPGIIGDVNVTYGWDDNMFEEDMSAGVDFDVGLQLSMPPSSFIYIPGVPFPVPFGVDIDIKISGCQYCATFMPVLGFIGVPITICWTAEGCVEQEDPNIWKDFDPQFPPSGNLPSLSFPNGGNTGYILELNYSAVQIEDKYFYQAFSNQTNRLHTGGDHTFLPWPNNPYTNNKIWTVNIPPEAIVEGRVEEYRYFSEGGGSGDCNRYKTTRREQVISLFINNIRVPGYICPTLGRSEVGFSYQLTELVSNQYCPRYTTRSEQGYSYRFENSPTFNVLVIPHYNSDPPNINLPRKNMSCDCQEALNLSLKRLEKKIDQVLKQQGKFPVVIDVPVRTRVQQRKVNSISEAFDIITYHDARTMAEFYGVIEPRDFDGKGYEISKDLLYPGGTGVEYFKSIGGVLEGIIRQIDRAVGKLPQTVKVKDANPAVQGDQGVELDIYSLSDGIKAIAQYLVDTSGDVDAGNNIAFRGMMTSGIVQQLTAVIDSKIDCIIDYLNIKTKYKKRNMPMAFDPSGGNSTARGFGQNQVIETVKLNNNTEQTLERVLPSVLRNVEYPVRLVEFDDKKMLTDWLIDFSRKVSVCAAALSVQGKPDAVVKQLDAMKLVSWAERVVNITDMERMIGVDKLGKWEEDVENQFNGVPGKWEVDPNNLYDKPATQRPQVKIRQSKKKKRR